MASTSEEERPLTKEGRPLTQYCPFKASACTWNCEWHDGDGCVIWRVLRVLKRLADDINLFDLEALKELRK